MLLIMLSKFLNCFSASFICFSEIWFIPAISVQPHCDMKEHTALHCSYLQSLTLC